MNRLIPSLAAMLLFGLVSPALAAPTETQRAETGQIIGAALSSDVAYERLRELCDDIGHRLSGSESLNRAIAWAMQGLREDGFTNVRAESVMVPAWVRGAESLELLAPYPRDLIMLGLGRSVGTPPEGIEAEVVVASTFEELVAMGVDKVRGKIVLWDAPFTTYGATVRYRSAGCDSASALGAVASLVRSVGPVSLQTPHTGALSYRDKHPRIPGAAISIEDATMIHRLVDSGVTVRVRLKMEARTDPDAPSANVVADIPGSEKPEEIVLLSGHLDSWDVGQGAQDDGAGCLIAWEAARLIHVLGLKPKRTLRVVLYTNEENGVAGGDAYAAAHADEMHNHVAAFESDSGNGPADGFRLDVRAVLAAGASAADSAAANADAASRLREAQELIAGMTPLLAPLDATALPTGFGGVDITPLAKLGVTCFGLNHDTTKYFEIHHTWADTFEKIDLNDLNRNVAIMAVMAFLVADAPERLP